MLSSLKNKLLSAKKNVGLFTSDKEAPSKCDNVDLGAGSEILTHYQDQWALIHECSEDNATKIEAIGSTIAQIATKIEGDKKSLGVMTQLLTQSKGLMANCTGQVQALFETFEKVEEELVALEDLIETVAFENMKKQHKFHLEQYKLRKHESLQGFEANLKAKYEKSLVEFEQKKSQELEERREVFQEAFKNDLEVFKSFGTIPKLDIKKQPSALLEEIQVDYDEKELDQFFEEPSNS